MRWHFWLTLFITLLLAPSSYAARPSTTASAPASSLLWKIEKPGLPASWLFGTIHLTDPKIAVLPGNALQALDGSRIVVTEIKLNDDSLRQVFVQRALTHTPELPALLGKTDYKRLVVALEARGQAQPLIDMLRPWAGWMFLLQPVQPKQPALPLDMQIAEHAQASNLENIGLETAEEQFALFENIDPARAVRLIRHGLNHQSEYDRITQELIAAYQHSDLVKLQKLSALSSPDLSKPDRIWEREWMHEMLENRNLRMAQRLQSILSEGGAFVAVGALHLPGPNGLIHLIEQQGYRVSAVTTSNPSKE